MKQIDRLPPALTGNDRQDIKALSDYVTYLQERVNFMFSLINRRLTEGENNGN